MSRSIEEIQKLIDNKTIINIVIQDCKFKLEKNKINIIFPEWLNYLERHSQNIIIDCISEYAPIVIENMYPNNKVLKTEIVND